LDNSSLSFLLGGLFFIHYKTSASATSHHQTEAGFFNASLEGASECGAAMAGLLDFLIKARITGSIR
jgi:hypothetical protein